MLDLRDLPPNESLRPISRLEYEQMVDMGLFHEDERLELLGGLLVKVSPQGTPHSWVIQQLTQLLIPLLSGRAILRVQLPFALSEDSEPEPDCAIVPKADYRQAHPSEALLVVEISDSSLAKDQRFKKGLYAAAGVPEYWIVNLVDRALEVYSDPVEGTYSQTRTAKAGQRLAPAAFPDILLEVNDLLPFTPGRPPL